MKLNTLGLWKDLSDESHVIKDQSHTLSFSLSNLMAPFGQICSWSILFDLEYYSRLFMLLEQLFLEHDLGPKSHKSIAPPKKKVLFHSMDDAGNKFKLQKLAF